MRVLVLAVRFNRGRRRSFTYRRLFTPTDYTVSLGTQISFHLLLFQTAYPLGWNP